MVALKTGEIDRFIAAPDARYAVVLIYGKDAGLVAERANQLAARVVAGSDDPFCLVRFDGDDIAGEPSRLAEEANTIGLFGGRRAIRVRVGQRSLIGALEFLLRAPPRDAVVIFEAGDLARSAPLRATIEKSAFAVALPCYLDEAQAIERLIDEEMRKAGLRIDPAARRHLSGMLGQDRLSTRSELAKLATYAMKDGLVTLDHIAAICGDESDIVVDALIDAVFLGDRAGTVRAFARLSGHGLRADSVIRAAISHAMLLSRMASEIASGRSIEETLAARVPYFKRRPAIRRQLQVWNPQRSIAAMAMLGEVLLASRKQDRIAEASIERALLQLRQFASTKSASA